MSKALWPVFAFRLSDRPTTGGASRSTAAILRETHPAISDASRLGFGRKTRRSHSSPCREGSQ